MELAEITKRAGGHKRARRVGRGPGCGNGKTCGRGHKGSRSRAGAQRLRLNEGGQMPVYRRIPKRGFNNALFETRFNVVNVQDLEQHFPAGAHITAAALVNAGLIRHKSLGVKVLGSGALTKKLTVEADRFSGQAMTKITAVGGKATVLAAASAG